MRAQLAAVQSVGGVPHDALVHPVLLGERDHRLRPRPRQPLEQRHCQATFLRRLAEHGRWKLQVIAGEDGAIRLEQRKVQRGLHRLGGFVDDRQIEAPLAQRVRFQPGERREHDLRALQHVRLRPIFPLSRFREQRTRLALLGARFREAAGTTLRPRRKPRLLVLANAGLQRVLQHGGQHPGRMADADGVESRCRQPLDQVVHREIRRRGCEHALATRGGAADHVDQDGRLPRSGRTVDEHHIPSPIRQIERRALLRIQ